MARNKRASAQIAPFTLFVSFLLAGCGLFGSDEQRQPFEPRVSAIAVNGYLWQAALDTISFMPLLETDVNSGLILTDWYSVPDNPDERVKVNVRFLSADLRSDAVRVNVSRQIKSGTQWIAAPVQASTTLQIEEAILTQARRLRIKADG